MLLDLIKNVLYIYILFNVYAVTVLNAINECNAGYDFLMNSNKFFSYSIEFFVFCILYLRLQKTQQNIVEHIFALKN